MNSKKIMTELSKISIKSIDIEQMLVYSFLKISNISYNKSQLLNEYMSKAKLDLCKKGHAILFTYLKIFTIENLIELFEHLVSDINKKENGVVYTPQNIRDYIVAQIFISKNTPIVLDPACGCGAFLVTVAEQLHSEYHLSFREIYSKKIFGVDVDKNAIRKSKLLLELLACSHGEFPTTNYNLLCANSLSPKTVTKLKKLCPNGFDCVIGNPPYVRFRNIGAKSKELLNNWSTSSGGNVDLYMVFFEIGMQLLNDNGVLGYITPNGYMQSINGRKLRTYLVENNNRISIIDFRDTQIFKYVTSYTCITLINAGLHSSKIQYVRINEKNALDSHSFSEYDSGLFPEGSPWRMRRSDIDLIIEKLETIGVPLSNWNIRNGLATLKNDLYFFVPEFEDDIYFHRTYKGKKHKIEKALCIKVVKPNIIKNENDLEEKIEQAIFPYSFKDGICSIIEETILSEKYPYGYKFLCKYKEILEKRDKGNGKYSAWYAYGRTQGMNLFGKKLLIPYISGAPVAVLSLDEKLLFYCGYAIISDNEDELRVLKCFLESDAFWYYIYHTSKPYSKGFMAFAKNYIVKFSIPKLTDDERKYLLSNPPKIELNNWIWEKYGIEQSSTNMH